MRKRFAILLVLVASIAFSQQVPRRAAAGHAHTCTSIPAGKIVKRVWPDFPRAATAKAITEGVVVEVTIDKQGAPQNLRVIKGDPALAKAVVEALRQWRSKPYKLNGEAVEVESSVYVRLDPLVK